MKSKTLALVGIAAFVVWLIKKQSTELAAKLAKAVPPASGP